METIQTNNTPPALWVELDRRLNELGAYLQESARLLERRMEETERRTRESEKEAERRARELEKEARRRAEEARQKAKEDERKAKEAKKEAEKEAVRKEREAIQREREIDKRLNKLDDLFTSQWGRLVESLVEGALVPLFQDYGIPIQRTARRVRGPQYEFDILVINGQELVIVEVKTTLRPADVTRFMEKLGKCKVWMPEYAAKTIYGGMAFLRADAEADRMAEKQKLFVIRATGDSATIVNQQGFQPREW